MHALRRSGLPAACPADGAIVQYSNGIVDFQQEHCIGCQYCVTGCPFNIPKFNPDTKKMFKCTLCSDRVGAGLEPACIKSCPTGCLHFGTKDDMKDLAETRAQQLREHYDSRMPASTIRRASAARTSSMCCTTSTIPKRYGGLPKDPHIPWTVRIWKGPAKWIGNLAMVGGILGVVIHYMRFGPKRLDEREVGKDEQEERKGGPS